MELDIRRRARWIAAPARAIAWLTCGALLGCCSTQQPEVPLHTVKTVRDAGTVDVAVIYVEPWAQVAQSLVPNFEITGASALSQVIPNTSDENTRLLDILSAKLGIGLPRTTTTRSETTNEASGQAPTTQSTATRETQPGQAPTASAGSAVTASSLPGVDAGAKPLGQDPLLQFTAAAALFQEVTILNRYVLGAAQRSDYEPYLVRIQVSEMPRARYEPYDTYVNMSFVTLQDPEHNADELLKLTKSVDAADGNPQARAKLANLFRQPIVIPLVVTDALEGGLTSNSSDVARSLALTLGGIIQNVDAKAELQSLQDKLSAIAGTDLNSLQTVGRISDNAIRVRLGAVRSPIGPNAYVMVPRTHYVTVLLMAPREWVKAETKEGGVGAHVYVAARTDFVNATTGKSLELIDMEKLGKDLQELSSMYFVDPLTTVNIPKPCDTRTFSPSRTEHDNDQQRKFKFLRYLAERVQEGDFECFTRALAGTYPQMIDAPFLWNELAALTTSYGFSGAKFQLPAAVVPSAPPSQTVLLLDDGKNASTGILRGGAGIVLDRLNVNLVAVDADGKRYSLPAQVALSGTDLQLSFVSLKNWGIKPAEQEAEIQLVQKSGPWDRTKYDFQCPDLRQSVCGQYPVIVETAAQVDVGFKVEASVSALPVKSDNTSAMALYVTFADKGADSVKISIAGGEPKNATTPTKGAKVSIASGILTVASPTPQRVEVRLGFDDVMDGGALKIASSGFRGKHKTGEAEPLNISLKASSRQSQQSGKAATTP